MHGLSRVAELWEPLEDGAVRCQACAHECLIPEGRTGVCRMRANRGGKLYAPSGYVAGLQIDPIEKKPFHHVLPGSPAFSFGMLGCNFSCRFCQNWRTSQTVKDPLSGSPVLECRAADLVAQAREHGCPVMVSTYNEPLLSAEWAAEVFRAAKESGLRCAFVSNGHATHRALEYLRPFIDFYKVDLKCFDEAHYWSTLGGHLAPVLRSIEDLLSFGVWVEIVTLVVPGFNDTDVELRMIARFLSSLSRDIPWHVTAFHSDYKDRSGEETSARTLCRAAEIGAEEGLRYVYAGNRPGEVGDLENTFCPSCRALLIERDGYRVRSNRLKDGNCHKCGMPIPGVWS